FLVRDGVQVIPPYTFDYIGENIPYEACFAPTGCPKDDWGFYKLQPDLWTLNKITNPLGGEILFNYEEDEYYTEAFSRDYWTEGLTFT
ncbi:hypothetical protein R0J91_17745, partial [Micrococcus sp. SIMBA_131]